MRLTTNCSLLTHELSEKLVDAGLDYFRISIEGLDAASYKSLCGVNIDYAKMLEEISYLYQISRGTQLEIAIKIVDASLHSTEDEERFFHIFSPISDHTFIERLKNIWPEYDDVPIDAGLDVRDLDYQTVHHTYEICAYPLTHMLVHSNGDIGVCCLDWKHATCYGNVNTMTLVDAWNSEHLRDFRIKHLQGRREEIPFCCECSQVSNDNVDEDAEVIIEKLRG